jgi:hypothetical protein
MSNLFPVEVSPFFRFYRYAVSILDESNNQIEQRRRQQEIFERGYAELTGTKEIDRGTYFAGSCIFSIKPLTGTEKLTFPHNLGRKVTSSNDLGYMVLVSPPVVFTSPIGM